VYDDSGSDRFKVFVAGTEKINVTDSAISAGGVALSGDKPRFDALKIGYDNNADDDIDDAGDDLIRDETFQETTTLTGYAHAGNLVDDGTFRFVYDAWNRLVSVKSSKDAGAVTFQTAEFDGLGRRMKKTVTNSGDLEGTVVYYYDGQRIIETRDGSGNLAQQFIHGTQYIDELVMVRVKDKGDLYVHQDANWNVIGLTDQGGSLVERHVYRPYGELTIHQETSFGDRDGDGDVDSTDKGTVGTTCTGTVSGACRILDLDFDGDYDSADATKFDSLAQGNARHPGRLFTSVDQPFGHQGLLFDAEIGSYQNRARQYDPAKRRFVQRDPLRLRNHLNTYTYVNNNTVIYVDPFGLFTAKDSFPYDDPSDPGRTIGNVVVEIEKENESDPSTDITITVTSTRTDQNGNPVNQTVFENPPPIDCTNCTVVGEPEVEKNPDGTVTVRLRARVNDDLGPDEGPGRDFGSKGSIGPEGTSGSDIKRRIRWDYSGTAVCEYCQGCTVSAEQGGP